MLIRRENNTLKFIGFGGVGKFVKIFNGLKRPDGVIFHADKSSSGFESFLIYDDEPELDALEPVFFIKKDRTLLKL